MVALHDGRGPVLHRLGATVTDLRLVVQTAGPASSDADKLDLIRLIGRQGLDADLSVGQARQQQ
jgi:hypothetical protein